MNKQTSKLESGLNWIKADKAYPKKSATLASFLNNNNHHHNGKTVSNNSLTSNPFSISSSTTTTNTIDSDNEKSKSFDQDTNRLIGMKDLCPEDKQRIANLIKELAKVAEEKRQLEKSLEEERKQKDTEIKEVIKQHQVLLNEKEKLLNKFTKTQEKLEQLKRHQKLMKLESSCLPPKPIKIAQLKANQQQNENSFNPYTSSTPMSQSPRNLSPIPIRVTSSPSEAYVKQTIDEESKTTILNENEELKKIELIKQRMDLMDEQKQLKELIDQQEKLLKEKQDQIMLQQQVHRERLEQLTQIRNFELEQQLQQQQQMLIASSTNFNQSQINNNNSREIQNDNDQNNSELIEKIAQQVYKQLVIKREENSTTLNESKMTNNNNNSKEKTIDDKIIINKNKTKNKQAKVIKEDEKLVQTNSGCVKIKKTIKSNNHIRKDNHEVVYNDDDNDLEESKLIEDLFFLK